MVGDTNKKRIVIVGGGTAGWMAANLMAAKWLRHGFDFLLIESPEIGIIGVGEGSTPQLKGFMTELDILESEWMPACNATYKTGITFRNWSAKPGFESYFHPFPAQTDDYTVPGFFYNSYLRRNGLNVEGHPDFFFLASYLAKQRLSPIPAENFPFEVNYGYHFDSGLLGQFLAKKASLQGVEHRNEKIVAVQLGHHGEIKSLKTESGADINGDIFIDCSGFRAELIQKALKVPFRAFSENLFNDSAVVFPTAAQNIVESQTISTALKNGWAWSIPLTSRIGNGYVYSSSFCTSDEAETEFRSHLNILDDDINARHIKMKVGRLEQHWFKNCVAVGLSQGFIEPLEATALHFVQETIQGFIEAYEKGGFTDSLRNEFNQSINNRFEAVRDYIVCHYRINSRTDTQYWIENGRNENLSSSLRAILEVWMSGKNLSDELARQKIDKYYPSISWHCMLAGYGIYPSSEQLLSGYDEAKKYKINDLERFIARCALNFKSHKEQLTFLNA